MDLMERIHRTFGSWYEGLFGAEDEIRPKEVMRRILSTVEQNRKEGVDNKVYVPNQIVLEICVPDEEEREFLYSFLDCGELAESIRRYCSQNGYHIRGELEISLKEISSETETPKDKIRIRCRFSARQKQSSAIAAPPAAASARLQNDELATVAAAIPDEPGTVASSHSLVLLVETPGSVPEERAFSGSTVLIGRSAKSGNNIVLAEDEMVSRQHARLEREADGGWTLYDLRTTNGTRVNGTLIENRSLQHKDIIEIGRTKLTVKMPQMSVQAADTLPAVCPTTAAAAELAVVLNGIEVDHFVLGTDTLIGRGVTNDIVLDDRSVALRHARITVENQTAAEGLSMDPPAVLNGVPMELGSKYPLRHGDTLTLGDMVLVYRERSA
jgi:pSer/pThr/pTyr-binding forkhead associated (FHA) protein